MKISILTVGKIKEKYLRDAIAEYSKRLGRYCKLEIIEVSDEKTPDNASETVEDAIRNKEGERLLKYIRDDAFVITLEIGGEQLTSENFARKINELGPAKPISAFGSARIISPSIAKLAVTPPVVGSVRTGT